MDHTCNRCGIPKPLSEYSETRQQGYKLQEDGKRYKLDMCKQCRREYNAKKKQEQREREAEAIAEAESKGVSFALLPVSNKAPLKSMKKQVIGNLRKVEIK